MVAFHKKSCPDCRFNNQDFACVNSSVANPRATEWEKRNLLNSRWVQFKGSTDKICHKQILKEAKKDE
jgi:hypothetical protein